MPGAVYRLAHVAEQSEMVDLIYITLTVAFFLSAIAYVRVCERLQ
ncbi:MAG TPA: hypothetical protein VFU83_03250 [Pyrinomonadaceae bacterium]|nr:hypothetical protein [Pyrinomonadaceae bacterium]